MVLWGSFTFQVTLGERLTLTLWFSRDSSHDEDAKLISLLSQNLLHGSDNASKLCLPLPASSNMYWFAPNQASHDELGFNICCARLNVLGYDIYFSDKISSFSDSSELLMEPLQLARADELFYKEFANILQALQVSWLLNPFKELLFAIIIWNMPVDWLQALEKGPACFS